MVIFGLTRLNGGDIMDGIKMNNRIIWTINKRRKRK
jgi:hypothetical protein